MAAWREPAAAIQGPLERLLKIASTTGLISCRAFGCQVRAPRSPSRSRAARRGCRRRGCRRMRAGRRSLVPGPHPADRLPGLAPPGLPLRIFLKGESDATPPLLCSLPWLPIAFDLKPPHFTPLTSPCQLPLLWMSLRGWNPHILALGQSLCSCVLSHGPRCLLRFIFRISAYTSPPPEKPAALS